jgi:ATP-dependent Lon protease
MNDSNQVAYPYYRPAGRSVNTGQNKSEAMLHLMPLNNGATPKDGPSRSVFSSPSFHYSPQTEQLVKGIICYFYFILIN